MELTSITMYSPNREPLSKTGGVWEMSGGRLPTPKYHLSESPALPHGWGLLVASSMACNFSGKPKNWMGYPGTLPVMYFKGDVTESEADLAHGDHRGWVFSSTAELQALKKKRFIFVEPPFIRNNPKLRLSTSVKNSNQTKLKFKPNQRCPLLIDVSLLGGRKNRGGEDREGEHRQSLRPCAPLPRA